MTVLAPAEWQWEDHPEVSMSDSCANGACEQCPGRFIDMDNGERFDCGCPHPHGKQDGA